MMSKIISKLVQVFMKRQIIFYLNSQYYIQIQVQNIKIKTMSWDQSEEWIQQDTSFHYKQKKQQSIVEQKRPERGKRGGELKANPKKQQNQEVQNQSNPLDQSNWFIEDQAKKQSQEQVKATRGAKCNNDISILYNQLQPDEPINSSWCASPPKNKPNQRGNRQNYKQSEKGQQAPKRGNRQSFNFTKKQPYIAQQSEQRPKGGYYANSSNNNNYKYKDQGNRGRGGGRGRGGYRGGYQGRQGQQDRDNRYQGRPQNNYYKKRDNQQATNEKEEGKHQQQGPKRGNRGNRQYNQNQGNRPYNQEYNSDSRNYNNNRGNNRNYNNRQYNNNRGQYNNSRGQYNNNRGQPYNNRSNGYYNNRDQDSSYNSRQSKTNSYFQKKQEQPTYLAKAQSKSINSSMSIEKSKQDLIPKGRRCWPQSSIYILGCKFCITYRPINEFKCKLLVIPYATLKMQYYPGNIINSSEVDYKARIVAKGEKISSPGAVYLQKAISVGPFIGLAFLKIQEKRISDSLKLGIKQLLHQIQNVQGPALESLIFPICEQLKNTQTIISSLLQNLQSCKKIKEVYVTTNQSQCFMEAMELFVNKVKEMLDDNEILIN